MTKLDEGFFPQKYKTGSTFKTDVIDHVHRSNEKIHMLFWQ